MKGVGITVKEFQTNMRTYMLGRLKKNREENSNDEILCCEIVQTINNNKQPSVVVNAITAEGFAMLIRHYYLLLGRRKNTA